MFLNLRFGTGSFITGSVGTESFGTSVSECFGFALCVIGGFGNGRFAARRCCTGSFCAESFGTGSVGTGSFGTSLNDCFGFAMCGNGRFGDGSFGAGSLNLVRAWCCKSSAP